MQVIVVQDKMYGTVRQKNVNNASLSSTTLLLYPTYYTLSWYPALLSFYSGTLCATLCATLLTFHTTLLLVAYAICVHGCYCST